MDFTGISKNKPLNYFLVASVIFIWGITFVSTKYLLRSFSSFEILAIRYIMAYFILWFMKPCVLKLEEKKNEIWFILAGLTGIVVYQFLENTAISYTLPANVSIIVSVCPMITAIAAQIFLHEKHLNFLFVLGFFIAITGIALVSFNGSIVLHLSPKGDFMALGSALCWASYSMVLTKINGMKLNPILCTRRAFFWSMIFMIPVLIFGASKASPDSAMFVNLDPVVNAQRWSDFYNWFNLLFLSLGASAFAFVAWNFACKNLGTVKVTVFIYMSPLVTILFAFLALGDRITLMGSAGAILTLCGLILSEKSKKHTDE